MLEQVTLDELTGRGENELVRAMVPVRRITPAEAENEVSSLVRGWGGIVRLDRSKRLEIVETAGRLRVIRDVIEAIENPSRLGRKLVPIQLEHRVAEDVLPVVRQMMDIPGEELALPDGTLQLAVDVDGTRIIARGDASRVEELREIVEILDVPGIAGSVALSTEVPRIYRYPVEGASPEMVLKVLRTLLAGDPEIRIDTDPETGSVYGFVRPSQHQRILETLDLMKANLREVDVIPLTSVDPQTAVLALNRIFDADGENPPKTAPKIDADLSMRSLIVHANSAQLALIRDLLGKMGENMEATNVRVSRGKLRVLPYSGREAQSALSQLEDIWPQLRGNRIRVVTPSALGIPTLRPSEEREAPSPAANTPRDGYFEEPPPRIDPADEPAVDRSTQHRRQGPRFRFVSDDRADLPRTLPRRDENAELGAPETSDRRASGNRDGDVLPGAPIIVSPGPGGLLVYSDDVEALDQFEELLTTLSSGGTSTRDYAVYYLKYAKASAVASIVTEIFGGGGSGGGGGASLIGDIAGAALGGTGGDLVGGLLGMGGGGGGGFSPIDIVADDRLNMLVVKGKAADLDTLLELLKILDQPNSPEEVQVDSRPRLIPVHNTSAQYVQTIVTQVYSDRMKSGAGGEARQPSPEDLIRALRGAGARRRRQFT